jgi:xanthosine utilization system XapX-like protein
MPAGGGLVATGVVVGASFGAGVFVEALAALFDFTARVTPGQATLVVGLLGLLLQFGMRLLDRRRSRRAGGKGEGRDA